MKGMRKHICTRINIFIYMHITYSENKICLAETAKLEKNNF